MIYSLNHEFTKVEETKGVLENKCRHTTIELVVTGDAPEKDTGIELQPKEKMPFRLEAKQSLYARGTSLDGIMANLAVVNFNVPALDVSGAGGDMVGDIKLRHILQQGYVKADGSLLSKSEYPVLFAFAQENELLLPKSEWENGMQGMYALDDDSTMFRVPDLRGQFLRALDDEAGVDSGRALGSVQGDSIRNITGIITRAGGSVFGAGSTTGCFDIVPEHGGAWGNNPDTYTANSVDFDASRVVPTAEENRPKNIALIAQIKY